MITSSYAAVLALFFILLSMRVIALRGNPLFAFLKTNIDDKRSLDRAIRGHANFAEYTPLMLVLMILAEQSGSAGWVIHDNAKPGGCECGIGNPRTRRSETT